MANRENAFPVWANFGGRACLVGEVAVMKSPIDIGHYSRRSLVLTMIDEIFLHSKLSFLRHSIAVSLSVVAFLFLR